MEDQDNLETTLDETPETEESFGVVIAKTVLIGTASTVGILTGFVVFGAVTDKVNGVRENRALKKEARAAKKAAKKAE